MYNTGLLSIYKSYQCIGTINYNSYYTIYTYTPCNIILDP